MFGGPLDYEQGMRMLKSRGFEPSDVLDVGANVGHWTRGCKLVWPRARVFMLEADPSLRSHLSSVGEPYAIVLLGNTTGNASMFMSDPRDHFLRTTGNSLFKEHSVYYRSGMFKPKTRRMERLDDVLAKRAPGRAFRMAKLDCQGAELLVLQGAPRTLADLEVLVVEVQVQNLNEGAPSVAQILAALSAFGFELYQILQLYNRPGPRQWKGVSLSYMDIVCVRRGSALWAERQTGIPPPGSWRASGQPSTFGTLPQ